MQLSTFCDARQPVLDMQPVLGHLYVCTSLGLLLRGKSAHIHKLVDNVEVAVVHSKVEGTPAKLH